ncbi:DUF4157 domain-containing protein [Paenibacillus sp. HB172176]|uniref:eCIS core domain-containing protein n=1 Tax=Paenibacillus sp. HB172176 TaxID=2493690 RepID=UPI00143C3EC1|nr:DUF4157 domain-containing protein [Paenibacillus sp. HB172176]
MHKAPQSSSSEPLLKKKTIQKMQSRSNTPVMQLQQSIGNQGVIELMKRESTIQRAEKPGSKANRTGLPDKLKSGIEQLSGHSMDDVKVHYQSDKPSMVGAHAYAQGTDIHIAPGQEKHLPHEAWHVVQQAQGRVKPTMQLQAAPINDDVSLEREADVMGAKALMRSGMEQDADAPAIQRQSAAGSSFSPETPLQLRKVNVGKKKVNNLQNAMKITEFSKAIEALCKDYDKERVLYFAGQLFSAEGEDIGSLDQFLIELGYDLDTKLLTNTEDTMTLQERYMTAYGWNRAANSPEKAKKINKSKKLKLYRTMSIDDYKELQKGNYKVLIGGHIGDFKQSLKYFLGSSTDSKVMVEFTLVAGGEDKLFSKSLAFQKGNEKLANVKKGIGGGDFQESSKNEGTSPDHIGIKSESEGEAFFSIAIGGGTTPEKFQSLVESVSLKQVGDRFSNESTSTGKQDRVEADANLLLNVNNCLINAIALAALGRHATIGELIAIRTQLGNYGEMLLATPQVVAIIQAVLNVPNPITVVYTHNSDVPSEDFDGIGQALLIYHVNGNHFTHEEQL